MYINLTPEEYGFTSKSQASRMNKTLNLWLANPSWTDRKLCAEAGIDITTFWRYKHNPVFMQTYTTACREMFSSLQAKAIQALSDKIDSRDFQAIKFALEGNDYTSKQKIEVSGDTNIKITIDEGDEA